MSFEVTVTPTVYNVEVEVNPSVQPFDVQVMTNQDLEDLVEEAKQYAEDAEDSADSASASASSASASATTATNQANIATNQALLASAARLNAQNAANAAEDSADASALSASSALASATSAELDAIATAADRVQTGLDRVATGADRVQTGLDRVATGADRVQTGIDANTASTQAGVATTQAGIATTQAGIATTQAGNALTSANNALNSANAAAASAASAAQVGTSTLLTGFTTGSNTTIAGTDTILGAFQKAQGQINARVSGTGVSGQVAFWSGTGTQSGSTSLTFDNTTKILDVNGLLEWPDLRLRASTQTSSVAGIRRSVGSNLQLYQTSAFPIDFVTNNLTRWSILSTGQLQSNGAQTIQTSTGLLSLQANAGNVGINTTTDAGFRLDVNGTARVQGVLTTTDDAVVNGLNIGRGGGAITTNTRVGVNALNANTTGGSNVAIGQSALNINTTGSNISAVGVGALQGNITGSGTCAIGRNAGRYIADGTTNNTITTNSVFIGINSRALADNQENQIVIGNTAIGLGSNTTVIGNSSTTFGRWWGNLLIGTSTNQASSVLTMESTTRGFLPPRMTSTERNAIATPATGLVVYNTTDNRLSVYNGTAWVNLATV